MRYPAVSGLFYPSNKDDLRNMLFNFDKNALSFLNGSMAVVPHAGYIYSGLTAMFSYKNIKIKDKIVIVGPNHYGIGPAISISNEDWLTPLGQARIDKRLVSKLNKDIPISEEAHIKEHSIEVQLPFIQYFKESFSFLPISIKDQTIENALMIAKLLQDIDATFIFSSDFSHYVPSSVAKQEDMLAITLIKEKNTEEFYETLIKRNWSICGYAGIMVFMELAKKKNLNISLVRYSNSGDINNDYSSVVAYASLVA